jgi:hypothetical protein
MAAFAFLPHRADHRRLFAPWAVPGFRRDAVIIDSRERMIWPWRDPRARFEFLRTLTSQGYSARRVGRA